MNDNQFATLGLKESIVKAISDLGFTKTISNTRTKYPCNT
ncbi:superfamily II DNA/RNA helicase [Clostridium beijerinckii]|nr:superfamily II DNA/RNA helicase [Clostridium beijerinckii]